MEKIEFEIFKKLAVYSLITGAVSAIFSLIPVFMPLFSLFLVPFFGALPPLYLLVVKDSFYSVQNKTYTLLGAFSGFFICLAFCLVFMPLVWVIHLIFKTYYDYGISFLNLFLFLLLFVMIATVYVTTNAVLGLIFGIVYKYFKEKQNG